jgi:hypothetical protein
VFVVGGASLEAFVEDADESVGELALGGIVVLAAIAEPVVVDVAGVTNFCRPDCRGMGLVPA